MLDVTKRKFVLPILWSSPSPGADTVSIFHFFASFSHSFNRTSRATDHRGVTRDISQQLGLNYDHRNVT